LSSKGGKRPGAGKKDSLTKKRALGGVDLRGEKGPKGDDVLAGKPVAADVKRGDD